MATPSSAPARLDRGSCFLFENMIKQHGQGYVVDMAREDTPAGHLVRRFLQQERRMTFVYTNGKWFSGLDVVPGPSPLCTLTPAKTPHDSTWLTPSASFHPRCTSLPCKTCEDDPINAKPGKGAPASSKKPAKVMFMGFMLPPDVVANLKAAFAHHQATT